jgi:hypothetical protein
METKVCKKCGRELPISEFYVHKEMNDGHLSFCKECVRARVHKHREDNIERIREYDRNRPNIKERRQKQKERLKNDKEKREQYYIKRNEWSKKNKYKKGANNKVRNALKSGVLKNPQKCEVCGKINCDIEAHHYDYSKPLDVIWLCTECHGKVHRQYNKLELDIEQIKKNREEEN